MDFKICIEPGHHNIDVSADETVLDAALRRGIPLPHACRSGTCGSCKARVIAGEGAAGSSVATTLSAQDRLLGYTLLCQLRPCSDMTIETRLAATGSVRRVPCRVTKVARLTHDVAQVCLRLPASQGLDFSPGQYIDIIQKDGGRRSFSLANAPVDGQFLELHVRHVAGGEFSEYVFAAMKEKDLLRIEGPFGDYRFDATRSEPLVFVVGGTGFAPAKSIIESALAQDSRRTVYLYWGVRAQRDLYMQGLIEEWMRQLPLTYVPVLSDPLSGDSPDYRRGLVHEAVLEDLPSMSGLEVYAGGPPPLVKAARDAFLVRGLDPSAFYADPFEYAYRRR